MVCNRLKKMFTNHEQLKNMNKAEQVRKKLEKKESEILKATKIFLNSHGIEYNEIHETILKNAMREMIGCCRSLIQPEFEKLVKSIRKTRQIVEK